MNRAAKFYKIKHKDRHYKSNKQKMSIYFVKENKNLTFKVPRNDSLILFYVLLMYCMWEVT